jgi:hypothetical protein
MTLKCVSLNSFLIAALLTSASTPEPTKREKSELRVSCATSSIVGRGTGSSAGAGAGMATGAGSSATGVASAKGPLGSGES